MLRYKSTTLHYICFLTRRFLMFQRTLKVLIAKCQKINSPTNFAQKFPSTLFLLVYACVCVCVGFFYYILFICTFHQLLNLRRNFHVHTYIHTCVYCSKRERYRARELCLHYHPVPCVTFLTVYRYTHTQRYPRANIYTRPLYSAFFN